MIEINASQGGQMLRTSLALSALTRQPVRVTDIRASRPNPGLKAQHLTAVQTLATICNAELKGTKPGSTAIEFSPKQIKPVNLSVNIQTAGAISLLLQQVQPAALLEEVRLRIAGGTNVAWSPAVEFTQHALFPALRSMGARFELKVVKRGFFPKGQGYVVFSSKKARLPLQPLNLTELGSLQFIEIFSSSASLPEDVSRNQAIAAKHALQHLGVEFRETIESMEQAATIGSSISLFAHFSKGAVLGGSALGAKGKPADAVGREAAQDLLSELQAKQPCDRHLADQLLPFMALARGKSQICCTKLTQHCLANTIVAEKFLPAKFLVEGSLGKPARIAIEGVAFAP